MNAVKENIIEFRPMVEADLDEVMRIELESHFAPWTRGIFIDCLRVGYYCPVLAINNKILAYAVMSVVAGEAHIFNVCVDKKHQGQGFGRKVVLHLLE
ncbi:MAG: GNAT family N-acetyltransferase, partial [Gammaproteobacteria bacterium]|nr:GNAT family N-acetyltransferase [Gammaproteobacteria bacterium]